jgi:hypothetical protein
LAHPAAHAFVRIDDTSVKGRFDDDGVIRAGVGAWNRMRALLAEVLHDQSVPPVAKTVPSCVKPLWAKVDIPIYLDPRNTRLGLTIIELRTGQFAAPAPHTSGRIGENDPFGLLHNDERFRTSFGQRRSQGGYSDDRNTAQFQKLASGHAFICICNPIFDHNDLLAEIWD